MILKGIPKLKTNFWLQKGINIIRYLVLTNIFFFFFLPFSFKKKALEVKEKCVGGQEKVPWGSRRNKYIYFFPAEYQTFI